MILDRMNIQCMKYLCDTNGCVVREAKAFVDATNVSCGRCIRISLTRVFNNKGSYKHGHSLNITV